MEQNHEIADTQRIAKILEPVANRAGAAADDEPFFQKILVAPFLQ